MTEITTRDVMRDHLNCLGSKFDPSRHYSLCLKGTPLSNNRIASGWEVAIETVREPESDVEMILLVSPKEPTNV